MRKRRKSKNYRESISSNENVNEGLDLTCESPKIEIIPGKPSCPDPSQWKDADIDTIIKCEAEFFCDVLRRLSKAINCARDLDDLDNVISLATKFLQASAAKEKAIACQIAASKGICCPEKNKHDCICDLDENIEDNK